MSQLGRLYVIDTDPTLHFTGAIVQNAQEQEDLTPDQSIGASPDCRFRIVSVVLIALQNLDWEITFWSKAAGPLAPSVADDSYLGRITLAQATGVTIVGSAVASFRYYATGLDLHYVDEDADAARIPPFKQGRIHMGLVPRSAGKTAGPPGFVKLRLIVDPTQGQT